MGFAKDMLMAKEDLEKLGHTVELPHSAELYANGTLSEEGKWEKLENDVIKGHFKTIEESDAVLIINKDKNGIENYLGGNSLLELGFAHILDKKKYLLNPVPEINYKDEIEAMEPIIINGDLNLII